jgi:tetratricopeptide (TPR) repeat protein
MREHDEELGDIKREIIESRGLLIKTNNMAAALAADLKAVAKRQLAYEGRISWNSATAYLVFVFVVFGALKLAWDARVDQISAKTAGQATENEKLRKESIESQKREEDRQRAELKAMAFYELLRLGKKIDIIDAYTGLQKEALSAAERKFFGDAVDSARLELSNQVYLQGLDKARLQRWQEAANAFEESLRLREDMSSSAVVRLALADAYRHLGRQRDAVPLLEKLAVNVANREVHDDALYLLAFCQTEVQAWNDAKESWRTLIRKFPESHFAAEGKMYLAQLNAMH